ncbi:MAG: hypothetical protein WDM90_02965 [Ferruginibacter sp.]
MKKFTVVLTAITCILLLSNFTIHHANKKLYDPKYYVAIGKENYSDGKKASYVVSNVVYVGCDNYHSTTTVTNQLITYYDAYYKKNRGSVSFVDRIAWAFDTKSAAESKRRELIADYNNGKFDVLMMERFSVICDN